jgi:putative transposase
VREDEVERGQRDGTMREEHAEIVKLRREARRLEEEKLILQKRRISRAGDRSAAMTFQLIDQERAHHAVSRLCSVLNVSRQGYWAWKQHPASRRRLEDERLKRRILAAWTKSDRTYGAPRLQAELRLGGGVKVGKKRVARLMRELEIQGVSRRRGTMRTTIPDKRTAPAPDLVKRNFTAERPDETWVADITYVPTQEGWLFLAAVMDLYSRKIVGWSMRDDLEAPLVVDAISMAITRRKPKPGLVHHSDRGSQYASIAMGRTLRDSKIMASMGSKGDPWDNACAESCISTIKNELVKRRTFTTRDQARLALFRYIESFYNPLRRHSSLEMRSPDEYEHRYREDNAAAAAA